MSTLFVQADIAVNMFRQTHQVNVSEAFINCADVQLTALFEQQTGLKASYHVCFAITSGTGGLHYIKGKESQLSIEIYINLHWNPIVIKWQSKSGRIYELTDTDIDCNDIEFSFGKLDADLYRRQLYPEVTLPFELEDINYELQIDRINVDVEITLTLKKPVDTDTLIRDIEDIREAYDMDSEKNGWQLGAVHSLNARAIDEKTVLCKFDLGSASVLFLKVLLEVIASWNIVERVHIG